MKKGLLVLMTLLSTQAFANNSEESKVGLSSTLGSLYSDVECDMSDYTCYRPILDLGHEAAVNHIVTGEKTPSTVLSKAISTYKIVNPEASVLSDEQIIQNLALQK